MTPRELTSAAIRHLPGEPSPERPQHGPITDLVRKDRCGVTAYEGLCDGKSVCLVEVGVNNWTLRAADSLIAGGPLVEVLGVKAGDIWTSPTGYRWTVEGTSFGAVLTMRCEDGRVTATAATWLADGWRPEAPQ